MSPSIREQTDDQQIDLGTGVDRRLLLAAAGLGLVVIFALGLVCILAKPEAPPKDEPAVAQRPTAPPRANTYPVPALPKPQSVPRDDRPSETAVVVAKDPAPPETPKPQPKPDVVVVAPAPRVEAPVAKAPPELAPDIHTYQPPTFKRHDWYGDRELRIRLAQESRELDVDAEKGTTEKLLDVPMKKAKVQAGEARLVEEKEVSKSQSKSPSILDLVAQRADLKGLPVRNLDDCQAPEEDAKTIQEMSREVRRLTSKLPSRRDAADNSSEAAIEDKERDRHLVAFIRDRVKGAKWSEDMGVRMLVQMFQAEGFGTRMEVVKTLAGSKTKNASAALARMAVFDFNAEIREAAVAALKDRSHVEYRPVLLEALRYPWPPVADHAAEALVALKDKRVVSELARLVDKPDPRAPTLDKDNHWVVPELVRINHLANCVLCHAPSRDKKDLVRGVVPERGEPLPAVYYESERGNFVRADMTYLKQDFSLMQPVSDSNKWPKLQRFDYLIRMRELTADEVSRLPASKGRAEDNLPTYPQRAAVLWALRELTGQDKDASSADWEATLKDARTKADP
jgi:hypothetical protein